MMSGEIGKGNPEFCKIPFRKGKNMFLNAGVPKAKQLTNWKPEVSLEDSLNNYFSY